MKRRSTTNSRPHENLALREEYKFYHAWCELRGTLKRTIGGEWPVDAADVNHIFSLGRRPDSRTNLICVSRPAHEWFHANLQDGRVACLYVKLLKRELDTDEFTQASGALLGGWLAAHVPSEPFRELHGKLLEFAECRSILNQE